MGLKQKIESLMQTNSRIAADRADQYEYNLFYDAATDSHMLVHQKLSALEGLQSLSVERWSGDHFIKTAA